MYCIHLHVYHIKRLVKRKYYVFNSMTPLDSQTIELQERYASVLSMIAKSKHELLDATLKEIALYRELCPKGQLDRRGKKMFKDSLAVSIGSMLVDLDFKKPVLEDSSVKIKRKSKKNTSGVSEDLFLSGVVNFCEQNSISNIVHHEDVWVSLFDKFQSNAKRKVDFLSYLKRLDCSEYIACPHGGHMASIHVALAKAKLLERQRYNASHVLEVS